MEYSNNISNTKNITCQDSIGAKPSLGLQAQVHQ